VTPTQLARALDAGAWKAACVRPAVAAFLRTWSDELGDDDRARLITHHVVLIALDTHTTDADDRTAAWLAVDWIVRVHAAAWLDAAGICHALASLAPIVDMTTARAASAALVDASAFAIRMRDGTDPHTMGGTLAAAMAAARASHVWEPCTGIARDVAWWAARLVPRHDAHDVRAVLEISAMHLLARMCKVGR